MPQLSIVTRESDLALWQANHVKDCLEAAHPDLDCKILGVTTQGDRDKVTPLSQMGGKGVFIKELEKALIDGTADIAVHSMKDVPGDMPSGLGIHAMVERADPRDGFVCPRFDSLADLPNGSVVGSSSLRRVFQLRDAFPNLEFRDIRGNVDTRIRKLLDGDYDAIILAVAGLVRLGRGDEVTDAIDVQTSIPAAGQGAIGIECRSDDTQTLDRLAAINHVPTWLRVDAERTVTRALGATCNLPIAVFAQTGQQIRINAFVASLDGTRIIRSDISGPTDQANVLAAELGQTLIDRGALDMMSGH